MSVYIDTGRVSVLECQSLDTRSGESVSLPADDPLQWCGALEAGCMLYFPKSPVFPAAEDHAFLLAQKQMECAHHKNIAYRPDEDRISGIPKQANPDTEPLQRILKWYSQQAGQFLNTFLSPYAGWKWDYASFRPVEEEGRKLRLRARNDLIHIDSFPTRPTYGGRILRFFTNIHPTKDRVWQTSDTMEWLAPRYVSKIPLPGSLERKNPPHPNPNGWQSLLKKFGLSQSGQSAYDQWMMRLHNHLKEDTRFQITCRKAQWAFPPGSSWMVMSDMVSHAVLSGQYALEQTVIVPLDKMLYPEKAPLYILERLTR